MKKFKILALILTLVLLLSGCKKAPSQEVLAEAVYPAISYVEYTEQDTPSDFYKKAAPILLSADTNSVCSPFSLYITLSALAECTEGESQKQLLNVLGSDYAYKNTKTANEQFRLANVDDTKLATSLWIGDGCTPLPSLKETLSTQLVTSMYNADFTTDDAKNRISEWINSNTDNFIKDAVADLEFNADTFMAIVSTLYFDSEWSKAFDKEKTAPDTFFAKSGDVTVDFMNEFVEHGRVYSFSDSAAVTKWFKNGCEMVLILPNEDKTPADVIKSGEFFNLLSSSTPGTTYDINLSLPKFDIMSDIELIEGLKSLGVTDIFDSGLADFAPLGPKNAGQVDKLQQISRITISEDSVKAASGTIIGGSWADASDPPEEIDFKLNRPFVFMIKKGSVPLFVGTVADPTK